MRAATPATERARRSRDNGVASTSAPLRSACVASLSHFGSLIDLSRFLRFYRELQCYSPAFRLTTCQLLPTNHQSPPFQSPTQAIRNHGNSKKTNSRDPSPSPTFAHIRGHESPVTNHESQNF
jgi:hypothetical protein